MTFTYPADELRFREQTARPAQMPGVILPPFGCVACGRRSVTKACKRRSIGRSCAACNQAREYRKAFREAQA